MAISIPFGAQNGITAQSDETDVSIGKLFAGGHSIYLFAQNKIKKSSTTKTQYASCAQWIVPGVNDTGSIGEGAGYYPLENTTASYQEDTNIIWVAADPGNTPPEITTTTNVAPATKVDCIILIGYNANFNISVKGPEGILTGSDVPKTLFGALGVTLPESPVWNRGTSKQMNRTDWQVFTVTGKGYHVGGYTEIDTAAASISTDIGVRQTGSNGANCSYFQINYSANSRGDVTQTLTRMTVMDT